MALDEYFMTFCASCLFTYFLYIYSPVGQPAVLQLPIPEGCLPAPPSDHRGAEMNGDIVHYMRFVSMVMSCHNGIPIAWQNNIVGMEGDSIIFSFSKASSRIGLPALSDNA
jgi:hypothetical protein